MNDDDTVELNVNKAPANQPLINRQNQLRRGETRDFYPTPYNITLALINHPFMSPFFKKTAFEPCFGEGHISRVLLRTGFAKHVIERDMFVQNEEGKTYDFLSDEPPPYEEFDYIITNPPYGNNKYDFLQRCIDLDKPAFLLLPMQTFYSARFNEMKGDFRGKMDFIALGNTTFRQRNPFSDFVWVCINTGFHHRLPRIETIYLKPRNDPDGDLELADYFMEDYEDFEPYVEIMLTDKSFSTTDINFDI